MRLYVTGGSGYLGSYLISAAHALGWEVRSCHYTHPSDTTQDTVDLRDRGALTRAINAFRPDAVIHTAYRQNDPDLHAVTVLGAVEAAAASALLNARHIHLSSDMVFAGTADEYDEIDMPDPIVPYGVAKAVAEAAVAQAHPEASIVRTSLIYSMPSDTPGRHDQIALDAAAGRNAMSFFTDEWRCPVLVNELVAALLTLVAHDHRGPLHLVGAEPISRYDFARAIVAARGGDPDRIVGGRLADSPTPRPARLILRSSYSNPAWQLRSAAAVLNHP
jgi:dTDP-4-dehydrorhamnose reductase